MWLPLARNQRADEARAAGIAVAAAIASLVFWSIADEQRALADANAHEAAQRAIVADAGAALARGENDKVLALALTAVERGNPQPQAYFVLAEAADAGARRRFGFDAPVFAAAFSPDGATAFTGSFDGSVLRWDVGAQRFDTLLFALSGVVHTEPQREPRPDARRRAEPDRLGSRAQHEGDQATRRACKQDGTRRH